MSDSELSAPENASLPADAEIEEALRRVVRTALKHEEEITIKKARAHVEEEFDLDAGFLKDDPKWKQRSKDIINAAVDEPQSPERPKKSAPKPKPARSAPKAGTKRKSDEPQPQAKRRKAAVAADSEEDDDADEIVNEDEDEPPQVKTVRNGGRSKKSATKDGDDLEDEDDDAAEPTDEKDQPEVDVPKTNDTAAEDDESDFSSVIDEPPKKKRQKKSTSPSETKSKSKKGANPPKAKSAGKELSADEEEIKRLQGWLVKCGLRKLWHKELAGCDTNKEKIRHLKKMLEEVGMTGRYSAEKARQIKESRELAAEIEAAKEFNEQWGHESGDEDEEDDAAKKEDKDAKPRRARPKGLIDFGDSGDDASD